LQLRMKRIEPGRDALLGMTILTYRYVDRFTRAEILDDEPCYEGLWGRIGEV
jgi:hypothetical protein